VAMGNVLLRIEIPEDGQQSCLRFRVSGKEPITVPSVQSNQLVAARDGLREILEEFLNTIGPNLRITDFSSLDCAIAQLASRGQTLLFRLLQADGTRKLDQFIENNLPAIIYPLGAEIPIVEIDASREYVHFEILPLFARGRHQTILDDKSLQNAMSRFMGMSTIIRRTSRRKQWPGVLKNNGRIPLKLFCDSSLTGARNELRFFQGLPTRIDLDGPWPVPKIRKSDFASKLALWLVKPNKAFDETERSPIDQIHHISCHCYTDDKSPDRYYLEFSAPDGSQYTATVTTHASAAV
jgi:hypothetical protein